MRKTLKYTVTNEGRDKGKVFLITEMSAADAEDWAIQAFLAMAASGVQIPDNFKEAGFAAVISSAFEAIGKLQYERAKPLLDRMMECVQIIPDPSKPNVVRSLIDDDIEEVSTRLMLRKETFQLHASFLKTAAR